MQKRNEMLKIIKKTFNDKNITDELTENEIIEILAIIERPTVSFRNKLVAQLENIEEVNP